MATLCTADRPTGRQVYTPTDRHTDMSIHRQVQVRLCGKIMHSRQADTPTGRHTDMSTHRQVLHVVYMATLCTLDRPIGRQAYMSIGREVHTDRSTHRQVLHVVHAAALRTSDRPIGRQADRSTHRQCDTPSGRHTV